MIDPVRHMSLRRRVTLAVVIVNVLIILTLLAFALR